MSCQGGGLCFILLCCFLAASANVILENITSEAVNVDAMGTLTLRCNATEVPGATVVWRREYSRNITLRKETRFEIVDEEFSTIEGDPLIMRFIERGDRGAYICTASNGGDPSVRKRFIVDVDYAPDIDIRQYHVSAALGDYVRFQCFVQAQPRGTNTWTTFIGKYSGPIPAVPLVNSDKYFIEERQENEHTTVMELTVRNVEPADYRTYSCGSTNRLGGLNVNRILHQSRGNSSNVLF